VLPQRGENGYVCGHCEAEARKTFPNLEALWRDHLFEPFLEWVNKKLATAEAVGFYGSLSSGWTHAELLPNYDPRRASPEVFIVPLRRLRYPIIN
jgi:hypothetical protein